MTLDREKTVLSLSLPNRAIPPLEAAFCKVQHVDTSVGTSNKYSGPNKLTKIIFGNF
jgi:hypothetical protein